jgi:site-specific DNA-methyltransferase (adenine-specific)
MAELYNDNCLNVFKDIATESIDCFVSDVPYKIVAGGVKIEERDDECGGILNRRIKTVSDGTNCSNKWLKKNGEIPSAVRQGKMFSHNDIKFEEWLPEVYRVLKKGTHAYIMVNSRNLCELQQKAEEVGFVFQNLLIWDKKNFTPNKYYMQGFECILMLSKRPARNINDMGSKNIISIPNIIGTKEHPTEKPVALMEYLILNSTNEDDIVMDSFMGAGSTIIAAIKNNRKAIGIEIDDYFYEIAKERVDRFKKGKSINKDNNVSDNQMSIFDVV